MSPHVTAAPTRPEPHRPTSVGEIYPDVQAVAVPLGRIDRGEIAAINCSFQGRALNESWLLETVAPQLQTLARQLA